VTKTRKPPRKARLIPADEVFAKWRKDPGYRQAYDALEEEFAIMSALIKARAAAGLSQSDVAKRMNTTQPAVARLEGGAHRASLKTIKNYAAATGHRVKISLEVIAPKR
jgi:ribosome-binding protein aMBF1 (putative translation factor)